MIPGIIRSMWVVLHHWQDDDYKGIDSGVHEAWQCRTEAAARAHAVEVLRGLIARRADDPKLAAWLKASGRADDLEDFAATLTDDDVRELHGRLYQGEFIPGRTEWVTVRQAKVP